MVYPAEKLKAARSPDRVVFFFKRILRIRILNFMFVGGIGYIVNMGFYYPLTHIFKDQATFLGQEFYLPPYFISSIIAITCNYYLNRIITFKDSKEAKLGMLKYMSTYLFSLPIEVIFIFLIVRFMKLEPVIAAALAILIVFLGRYLTVKTVVWKLKSDEH
jgi:putative flippase GtrA